MILVFIYKHYQIGADVIVENISNQITISKIPEYSSGRTKLTAQEYSFSIPQGEKKSFEILFENKSSKDYNNITIAKDDLHNGSKIISKANIDERVIHSMPKKFVPITFPASSAAQCTQKVIAEELLVKNEIPSLTIPSDSAGGKDPFFSQDIDLLPGTLPKEDGYANSESGDGVKTAVKADSNKKFYFTISAPKDSVGSYQSTIRFVDKNANIAIAKFEITVNIFNVHLPSLSETQPSFNSGTFLNDQIANNTTPPANWAHYFVNAELFSKRVQKLKDQGITTMVIRVGRHSDSHAMIKIINDLGFAGPIILNFYGTLPDGDINRNSDLTSLTDKNAFKQVITSFKDDPTITIPIIFYGIDEPNNTEKQALHQTKAENILALLNEVYAGGSMRNVTPEITSAATPETFSTFEANSATKTSYKINNFLTPSFMTRVTNIKSGQESASLNEGYYFQGWPIIQKNEQDFIPKNRYYMGIGLAKSGVKGSFINPVYGYSAISQKPFWDDFTNDGCNKPMFTFYPASNGLIPTMQSESWREGVMDLRFYSEYKRINSNLQNESENLRNTLQPISTEIEKSLTNYTFNIQSPIEMPNSLTPENMTTTRDLLEKYIFSYYSLGKSQIVSININEGQSITFNPYVISVKVNNPSFVSKVEFYVDNNLIGTSTLPDVSGNYEAIWDTSKFHSVIKIIVYDLAGQTSELTRNTTVNLGDQVTNNNPLIYQLPNTGRD